MNDSPVLDGAEAIHHHLHDVLEPWERRRHGVRFVLCGGDNRVQIHCPVDHVPIDPDPADCAHAVSVFANALAERKGDGALLVVLTRPGTAMVTDPDRHWFHAAYETAAKIGVRLLGVYLVTPDKQREIVLDDAL